MSYLEHFTTEVLREILSIVEEKDKITKELAATDSKLDKFLSGGFLPSPAQISKVKAAKPVKSVKASTVKLGPRVEAASKPKRGNLSYAIIEALKGKPEGMSVPDLAKIVGSKPASLHVFFNTTGKKIAGLKRVGRGIYALTGTTISSKPKSETESVVESAASEPAIVPVDEVGSSTVAPAPVVAEPAPVLEASPTFEPPIEPELAQESVISEAASSEPEPSLIEEERIVVLDEELPVDQAEASETASSETQSDLLLHR